MASPPASLCGLLPRKVPSRGRFRSDNHAAVLRLQRTQPKDRRAYNAPYRNPCRAAGRTGKQGRVMPNFFICTRWGVNYIDFLYKFHYNE
ncbi:hypothetical protein DXA36_16125 [Eisenbergiella sp. OF01-20]|nr:hypothetical protein DXA36_16125 [Eisenbergiella sp. OF01-20]